MVTQTRRDRIWIFFLKIIPFILIFFGLLDLFAPYVFVSSYKGEVWLSIVDINDFNNANELGKIIINMESKGALTVNYPIDVSVKMDVYDNNLKNQILSSRSVSLHLPQAKKYPLKMTEEGVYQLADIYLDKNSLSGENKILFLYPGEISFATLRINGEEKVRMIGGGSPQEGYFTYIENNSVRNQIENNNKNLGLTIISIGLAILALRKEDSKKPTTSNSKKRKKSKSS